MYEISLHWKKMELVSKITHSMYQASSLFSTVPLAGGMSWLPKISTKKGTLGKGSVRL